MAEVFIAVRGQLDERSKRDLRKAGVVVVEMDDLSQGQFVKSSEVISGDVMLWAALEALNLRGEYGNKGEAQRERLASNLFAVVDAQRRSRSWSDGPTRREADE